MLCFGVGLGFPEEEPLRGCQLSKKLPQPEIRVIDAQIEVVPIEDHHGPSLIDQDIEVVFPAAGAFFHQPLPPFGEGFSSHFGP